MGKLCAIPPSPAATLAPEQSWSAMRLINNILDLQRIRAYLAALLIGVGGHAFAQSDNGPWLMVDTGEQTLTVMEGGQVKQTFKNISLGRNGYDLQRTAGDGGPRSACSAWRGSTPIAVFICFSA